MKSYFLEEFKNTNDYIKFINYMLINSDCFSLVYFKYREDEKTKKGIKEIQELLKPFKLHSARTNKWPGTVTYDDKHIYKLVFYTSKQECLSALSQVDNIFGWNYPMAPMDLCFYKDGYCWFSSISHERMAFLNTDENECIQQLQEIGANLKFIGEENNLFYMDSV